MAIFNRRGQSLVETIVLGSFFILFIFYLETCYEKIKPEYNRHKIQRYSATL